MNLETYNRLLDLYCEGDEIGANFESSPLFTDKDHRPRKPGGTDESDMIRCWREYLARDFPDLSPGGWIIYYANNYRDSGYGKAMPDTFRLVKYLLRHKPEELTYRKVVEISKDRNSMGNLCLGMVLPVLHYAQTVGEDPFRMVEEYVLLTHAHPIALAACDKLASLFLEEPPSLDPEFPTKGFGGHADAVSTLKTAWWCAQAPTKELAITECVWIGGDVDSTLALTLQLWGWMNDNI